MSAIHSHLEHISLCASAIGELPFPEPKIFTNALLHPHDITALIRDTEAHERALFSVPSPSSPPRARDPSLGSRRTTVLNNADELPGGGLNATRAPRRNTAVAAVLGGDLVEQIRRGGGGGVGSGLGYDYSGGRERSEVNVDVLLKGAEKLCSVYPIPGAAEKIISLRERHAQLRSSIAHYEAQVASQAAQLEKLNRAHALDEDMEFSDEPISEAALPSEDFMLTEDEMRQEEQEIRELERKRHGLEDRVSGMARDLGGLLR
ncbi:DASH complex, subunit Spc34 [Xylona heveae TC161]|uniref:DASH complex subunit SPC34 n=1 Tax=Xylona heveae (strain CBS 132557 / TC161) TaxID=1328760 RepID=A0A165G6A9_XYLHT|nr:DASH complex, subunit Spc34 [Xylona heveae TC161]KZF21789.1 DASH complex, subunit Spc34 [Xylona heveae TC161]